jgi:phospholipase C
MTPNITNVFVLMLENRSFDHMLGHSGLTGADGTIFDALGKAKGGHPSGVGS